MTLDETIADLRRKLAEATNGPWWGLYDDNGFYLVHADRAPSPYIVATGGEGSEAESNADLIVAAINTLPAILDALDARTKALEPFAGLLPDTVVPKDALQAQLQQWCRIARAALKETPSSETEHDRRNT